MKEKVHLFLEQILQLISVEENRPNINDLVKRECKKMKSSEEERERVERERHLYIL